MATRQIASTLVVVLMMTTQIACIYVLFFSILGGPVSTPTIETESDINSQTDLQSKQNEPVFNRLVIFLVDALRSDMVSDRTEMRFVRHMLATGKFKGYIARAHAPTVTMPRIKALMSGSVPQFLDLITNLASSSSESNTKHESLIMLLHSQGKRLVLFGDDTWQKLYPTAFLNRSDGTTSSFFTPDFVEVDLNVTRHIPEDFDPSSQHPHSTDWDVSVLHYLGLDHVGHQLGPSSKRMSEKLVEMDEAFERVARGIAEQDKRRNTRTMIVLLSDHGMNGAGNHGGSSLQETSSVAIFAHGNYGDLSSIHDSHERLVLEEAFQVDVAPTLGLAMGAGVPSKSVGCILKGAFPSNAVSQQAEEANLKHMVKVLNEPMDGGTSCPQIQERLLAKSMQDDTKGSHEMFNQTMCLLLLLMVVIMQFRHVQNDLTLGASVMVDVQCLGLASSSAIENEHATVFFTLTSLCVIFAAQHIRFETLETRYLALANWTCFAVLIRLARSRLEIINFAKLAGIKNRVFLNEATAVLPLSDGLGADPFSQWASCVLLTILALHGFQTFDVLEKVFIVSGTALCWGYLVTMRNSVAQWAVFFLLVSVARSVFVVRSRRALSSAVLMVGLLFIRRALIPLVLVCVLGMEFISSPLVNIQNDTDRIALFWLLGWAMFYAMGNTHSISTIDISGGYVGSDEYSRERVALITTFVVYFGPLMGSLKALEYQDAKKAARLLFMFQSARLAVCSIILVVMQSHLFIWSVFAPRWGYEILWTVTLNLILLCFC